MTDRLPFRRLSSPEARELIEEMFADLPGAALLVVDEDLRLVLAVGDALRASGFDAVTLAARSLNDLTPLEGSSVVSSIRDALLGTPFTCEHKNEGRVFLSRGTPLRGASGGVGAVLVILFDVTELWEANEVARTLAEGLKQAMASRAEIEQAKGILMGQLRISADEAFELLRKQSQHENVKVRELARELVCRSAARP